MQMPGRTYNSTDYRFGFGGQEKDDEIYGNGNSYTAEYWQYDPRLGRRWNVDPIVKDWESPYATFSNNPIYFSDPNGADATEPEKVSGPDDDCQTFDVNSKGQTVGIDVGTELKAVEVVAEGPKIAANHSGGFEVTIPKENAPDSKFSFMKKGNPYNPSQTPENYEYWKNNMDKFKNKDGSMAKFSDVFTSKSDIWGGIFEEEVVNWFGVKYPSPDGDYLEQKGTIHPDKKYEQWRYNFPARTKEETKIRVARDKEIAEMKLIQLIPISQRKSEEEGQLNMLENKYKK